jgi:hypothetical protein
MAPAPLVVGVATFAVGAVSRAVAARRAAARRARKPQLGFKRCRLDNSDAPFVHGSGGLNACTCGGGGGGEAGGEAGGGAAAADANCPLHGPDGQAHPHADAIEALLAALPLPCPPAALQPGHVPAAPAPLEDTPLVWVSREGELREMVAHLSGQPRFAMDLEHSPRGYHGVTCLIQISTGAAACRLASSCLRAPGGGAPARGADRAARPQWRRRPSQPRVPPRRRVRPPCTRPPPCGPLPLPHACVPGAVDYLVDAVALHDVLEPVFGPLMANPAITKVRRAGTRKPPQHAAC